MSCVSGRRFIKTPTLWLLLGGAAALVAAVVVGHPAVAHVWPMVPSGTAAALAGIGCALMVLALAGVARLLAHQRRAADLGVLLGRTLESEGEARLLRDAEGRVLFANAAARRLWPALDPIADTRARLYDPRRLPTLEDGVGRLERLAAAAEVAYAERLTLALRHALDGDTLSTDGAAGASEPVPWTPALDEPEWWDVSVRIVGEPMERWRARCAPRLWVARDITAQRAIDEVLTRERESLSDFLYFLPVGLYAVDADGRLRFVNQRMARWLDRTPEEVRGMALAAVVDGGTPPLADGDWRGDMRFVSADGHRFSALVSQATYEDAGELMTQGVVMREAADLSQEGEEPAAGAPGTWRWDRMFRWLFDGAPVGIALMDPDGRLTDCNRALQVLLRQSREDLLDQSLTALVSDADRAAVADALGRLLGGGDAGGVQLDITLDPEPAAASLDVPAEGAGQGHPPPPARPVTAALFLGPMGGKEGVLVEGVIAHLIDTSEQRSLERQFAQAQKMQAMGQLAGGVAHDFNNLLTAMIGYSDLLLQRHGTGDPSFADIMQIRQNANRAANLVRQLLAFSRRQPLRPRPLDVGAALSELSHLLRRLLGETILLRLVHGREVDRVRVDPGQFDQVIINLAVNARDAMPGGGELTIATRLARLDAPVDRGAETMPAGTYVVIEVRDTGKGISPDNLGRIFEPFFTTKGGTAVGAGTGLGLSTVYGILRQTGGFIDVSSTMGEGTTFSISLPRDVPAAETGAGDVAARADGPHDAVPSAAEPARGDAPEVEDLSGAGTILLVEDEDPVRMFAARALRNKGYTVLEAGTGEMALETMRDGPPLALLITDMVMPGMDGATLARQAREQRPELRVIIISGYSEDTARGDILEQPHIHFLPKPFSLKLLAETVKTVLAA
ncbi:response regulator [Roseospira marina]|uniref:histidine kinase n=1 Tax=Roseospira marina TaxID=140057 RepID=A0A5M6I8J8_9PROT|nr:ATP-binding protein [Roseospira marina]KAA5604513.1 response regulator [Roseospira marina]MBB4315570.1 two-component system cell cycle sensor histidine kinase/response regulator CckA [Roseospira marina]MBB5088493.1 two-component system cell cycle sensor histidine kinase/response regulator CckA [Roseospira marina]